MEYTNDGQAIRQHFIIREPGEADGKLTVQLQAENSWHTMYGSANSLIFKSKDQVFNYGDLEVEDATGKKLPAHFDVQQNQVEITVDAGRLLIRSLFKR
ncbi:hypothetical protein [Chitinophaga pinensis]|uniref:Uncharacterized protein n=1 Tax=Chitinophaga pinensis TaxID=79329 RepID=A0A5C6LNU2_9BACT|nr:hypothetical protein [Chitinophaga pinensis]TWV92577.1 hypothetical protein FEF09_28330 [Chitinophaga pinensis]